MAHFTPLSAAIGGSLIGLSAALLWISLGRIAGISGIIGSLPSARNADLDWRIAFLTGLITAPVLYSMAGGELPIIEIEAAWPIVVVGGVLVGTGTRLGSGCTSGHGVCGVARLSRRSIVGAVLFGIGWGLVGYCPGPALASILFGNPAALLFAASMLASMAAYGAAQFLSTRRAKARVAGQSLA